MFWKVCGITRKEDATAAVEAGADALGFVFFPPSERSVAAEDAAGIASGLPGEVKRVGVFVNSPRDEIEHLAELVGLDVIQLHGDESPTLASELPGTVWKALRAREREGLEELEARARPWADGARILLDAGAAGRWGGTGETVDWDLARQLAARHDLVLAGGLTPDNLAEAVESVRPWGVDVSSGVEAEAGKKDHEKLRRFAAALEPYR